MSGQQQTTMQGEQLQQQGQGGSFATSKPFKKKQQKYEGGYYKGQRKRKSSPWLFSAIFGLVPGIALITATLATILRFFAGFSVSRPLGSRPNKILKLYEFEGDPNSRLVREALSMLDLDCMIFPCPKGSKRFRAEAVRVGGKEKFPLLLDENSNSKIYGARNIVPYLFMTYGNGDVPLVLRMPFVGLSSFFASFVRGFRGIRRQKGIKDVELDPASIQLWNYEASPHCRLVREVLTELEIPYVLHNVAKRSPSRKRFVEKSGRMMVPYLIDSNTDKGSRGMFESRDIIKYLLKTYGHYGHYD